MYVYNHDVLHNDKWITVNIRYRNIDVVSKDLLEFVLHDGQVSPLSVTVFTQDH